MTAVQVFLLLRGQGVYTGAPALELHPGNLGVYLLRHTDDAGHVLSAVPHQIAGAQSLDGEAHVHDLGGMPVSRSQVDQTALGEDEH